jgi:PKD repeat protein
MNNYLKNALLIVLAAFTTVLVSCGEDDPTNAADPVAGFSFVVNNDTGVVTFTNESEDADTYAWDFGDGTTSTATSPSKTYTASGTYSVELTASTDAGDSDTDTQNVVVELTTVVVDTEAPVITLLGDATITLTVGDSFTDPGATANDNVDGDISTDIVVGGDAVDTGTAGTYTITYNVSDAAGNAATEVTRDVVVEEAAACTPETEETLSAVGLNWTFMSDPTADVIADNLLFFYIDNPDFDNEVNSSCKVGQITKNSTGPWENLQYVLDDKIDFTVYGGFTMKVWAFDEGASFFIKMEDKDVPGTAYETPSQSITATETWEELTFEWPEGGPTYDRLVLWFDGGDTSSKTYYFDDVKLFDRVTVECSTPAEGEFVINGDFETGDTCGWTSFAADNGGSFDVSTDQQNGGTYSGLVVADVDGLAGGAASFPVIKNANFGVGDLTAGEAVTVSFDLYGSVAGAGGVVFAELFSELSGGGTSKAEILGGGPLFPNSTWTTYSFDTTLGTDVSGGVTLQLKADCGANAGCVINAYFDNVSVVRTPM